MAVLVLCPLGAEAAKERQEPASRDEDADWLVYEQDTLAKNDLCQVLNCRKNEVCLVRNDNAMCVHRDRLDEVKGRKVFFNAETGHKTRHGHRGHKERHEAEGRATERPDADRPTEGVPAEASPTDPPSWDPERLQQKWRKYYDKHHKKPHPHEESLDNDVQADRRQQKLAAAKETHPKTHQRHSQEEEDKKDAIDCSQKQLIQMGARLLQWFSDVHAVEKSQNEVPLPKHHVTCPIEVGWMFQQLDTSQDAQLNVEELYSVEHDQYEPCIKPFLDRCDVNADDFISLDEWCDCFQWAGHEREEPPCHAARRKSDPHLLGSFNPRCDVDGYYKPQQCHDLECWCVDKYGREFDKSRAHGKADCGQYAEKDEDGEEAAK